MRLEDLRIYQFSLQASDVAWNIFLALPKPLQMSIGDQFIRSVDSIGANIAEGYGRYHYKDSNKFYYNARGSLSEANHWLRLLHMRALIVDDIFYSLSKLFEQLGKQLNVFIQKNGSKC